MAVKIYGSVLSTCTQRIVVVLKELSIPYEIVPVDFSKGEHKSAPFLEKQPFGQVPYLDDDGFILFESRAIARYLADKYAPGKLTPAAGDAKAAAYFLQAASIEQSNFDPSASGIVYQKVFAPMRGLTTNEERVKEHTDTLNGKLDGYERLLGKQKYLAGDKLTIVDLFHLPYGFMSEASGYAGLKDGKHPNVQRWWGEVSTLKSWKDVRTEADAEMAKMKGN